MIIWKEIGFGMRRCFGAGDRTNDHRTAAMISSTSRLRTSSRRCSGPDLFRNVLQVDANAVPGGRTPAHLIHQHVSRFQVLCDAGMLLLPLRQSSQRFLLILPAADL